MRTKLEAPYSWSFLEEFFFPDSPDWNAVITLAAAFRRSNEAYLSTVRALVARWDDALHGLGGEPLRENWARFRPLRRSREEDWSDWLAYLLESSRTGRLAALTFGRDHRSSVEPTIDRELKVGDRRRLDLCIRWSDTSMTTLEVKIGDQDFEKTWNAASLHRPSQSSPPCDDWILIPPKDAPLFDAWLSG